MPKAIFDLLERDYKRVDSSRAAWARGLCYEFFRPGPYAVSDFASADWSICIFAPKAHAFGVYNHEESSNLTPGCHRMRRETPS